MIIDIKLTYVRVVHALRRVADSVGLLRLLEAGKGEGSLWVRSLFAIYDLDDMIRLDIPWWVLPARRDVETFLATRPDASVFEWGSGASTVWLSKRAARVVSVEHDPEWYALMASRVAPNVSLRFVAAPLAQGADAVRSTRGKWKAHDFKDYVQAIPDDGRYDLIVVDGRCRVECFRRAVGHLKPGGMILFDNTGRSAYRAAIRQSGLAYRIYHLPAACLPYYDPTSLVRAP